jgi:hypothetical protein
VPRINRRALAVLAVSICAAAPVRGQTLLSQTTWGGPSFEVTEGLALASDAGTWGGAGLDAGGGVDVAADGSIALGATAEAPPYSLLSAPTKVSRPRGTLGVAPWPRSPTRGASSRIRRVRSARRTGARRSRVTSTRPW